MCGMELAAHLPLHPVECTHNLSLANVNIHRNFLVFVWANVALKMDAIGLCFHVLLEISPDIP